MHYVQLESCRLRLRPIMEQDAKGYLGLYGDAQAMTFLGGPWEFEACREGAKENQIRWEKYGFASWLVDLTEDDGSVVQNVALLGFDAPRDDSSVPFGWVVAPAYWKKGISTEASKLALDWFFENFDYRVITETVPTNLASRKTSEKLGFRFVSNKDDKYLCEMTPEQWKAIRMDCL